MSIEWFLVVFANSIKAYLGSSYTICNPTTYKTSEDKFEQSVLDIYPQGFRLVSIHKACSGGQNKDDTYWVMNSLNRAIEQYHQRPVSISTLKRPIGVILRHFFIAVQNNHGADALRLLNELKSHQRLSPRNILSLEIQALAAGQQWQKILQHSKLDDLVKGTIPRRLQNTLLESVGYDQNNSTVPSNYDAEKLSRDLQGLYPLFASLPDLENDDASSEKWKLWAIGAVSLGRTIATEQLPDCIEPKWISDLRQWCGFTPTSATSKSDTIPTLDILLDAGISTESATKLLAESIQASFKDRQRIYHKLSEYPSSFLKDLADENSYLPMLWDKLQEDHGSQIEIDSWHQLFKKLGGDCSVEEANSALTLSIERSDYWAADTWKESTVLHDIETISDDISQGTLRGILPILIRWLAEKKNHLPSDAIEHLMMLLVDDEQIATEDLLLCTDLLLMLLNQGHTKEQYRSLIECIDGCWRKIKNPRSVDVMLEVYEILIDYPCADENRRLQSWLLTQSDFISYWPRLDTQQKQFCHECALLFVNDITTLPQLDVVELDTERSNLVDLSGKRLAIYTLTAGAGRRARKILMNYFPGLEILLNHDKSATDALMNLATTADYFVFSSAQG